MFIEQFVTPIMIPILALLIPIVAIVAHYMTKAHRERQRHETMRELARAGLPIPPELLQADAQDSDWHRARREESNPNRILIPGFINISVGIGLMGMFAAMMPGYWLWAVGLIPTFLGIGLVAYWAVERKRLNQP